MLHQLPRRYILQLKTTSSNLKRSLKMFGEVYRPVYAVLQFSDYWPSIFGWTVFDSNVELIQLRNNKSRKNSSRIPLCANEFDDCEHNKLLVNMSQQKLSQIDFETVF